MAPSDDLEDPVEFEIDGARFTCGYVERSEPDLFTLVKSTSQLHRYEALLVEFKRPRMMELGIAYGGSLAYFALRAQPCKLVGIEYAKSRLDRLDRFIEHRGLTDVVRPYYGVDQADRDRLGEIVSTEFGGELLDLVIDDASHRYDATLASFETLFPSMRPGGLYVIEDWVGSHQLAETEQLASRIAELIESGCGPLSRLVIELMLTQTSGTQLIDELTVNRHWIAVRRGLAPLPTRTFRLSDHYRDSLGMLTAGRSPRTGAP